MRDESQRRRAMTPEREACLRHGAMTSADESYRVEMLEVLDAIAAERAARLEAEAKRASGNRAWRSRVRAISRFMDLAQFEAAKIRVASLFEELDAVCESE
jgi:hypothetical protein